MASYKSIPALKEDSVYSEWKKELAFWKHATNVELKKRAHTVILAMTGKPRTVATQLDPDALATDDGLDKLIKEMDKLFLKDNTQTLFCAIDTFEKFKRSQSMSMDDYISEFTRQYKNVVECREGKESYEDGVLAYKMLMQASLSSDEQRIVKAIAQPLSVAVMTSSLKRTFGEGVEITALPFKVCSSETKVKEEPIFLTKDSGYEGHTEREPIYWTSGNEENRERGRFRDNTTEGWKDMHQSRRGASYNAYQRARYKPYQRQRVNSHQGDNGSRSDQPYWRQRRSKEARRGCFICGDEDHFVNSCPHNSLTASEDGKDKGKVYAIIKRDFEPVTEETSNKALLDTGACATLCGRRWFSLYEQNLTEEEKEQIVTKNSVSWFKFGDGISVESTEEKIIPLNICGKEMLVRTFIVENDLPLLLSRQTMMNMGMVIDLNRMVVNVRDSYENENIQMTNSGHVSILIRKEDNRKECNNPVNMLQPIGTSSEKGALAVKEEKKTQDSTNNKMSEPTRGDRDSILLKSMGMEYQDSTHVTTGYPWEIFSFRTSANLEISDTSKKKMRTEPHPKCGVVKINRIQRKDSVVPGKELTVTSGVK